MGNINISNDLKDYCKYLIDKYDKIKFGEGGRVMTDLKQFYEEGTIKDLIKQKTTSKLKIGILNIYRDNILHFAELNGIELKLKKFKKFIKNKI